jgi:Ca2+-binding RTX toxin-like protein
LLIRDGISGDQVNLYNMLGGNLWGIQEVQFSNGTILTKQQLITMATTGSATNTVLTDSLGNATFDPAGYASKINAVGTGNNTFVYNSGYGSVEISAYNSSSTNNVLAFGTGIAASQISITSDIYGDVLMTDGVTGDQVKLDDMVGSSHWGVQAVQFANGTAWNSTFLSSLKLGASGNDTLNGTTGNDTFYGSPGNDVMNGDGGYDSYNIGKNVVTTTINNAISGGTAANGEIDFLSGISDENLWFQQSGNNLEIERLGTTSQITISGWFGSNASAQVEKLTAGGLTLDNQVSQLVSAMATYAANNSGFNPATATSMPTDSTLQNAIAAAWHT